MTTVLCPLAIQTPPSDSFTAVPGANAKFYLSGTSTPAAVYDESGASLGTTVTADAFGHFPAIYLDTGVAYKLDMTDSSDVSLTGYPVDPVNVSLPATAVTVTGTAGENLTAGQVVALSDGSGGGVAGRWYKADADRLDLSTSAEIGIAFQSILSGASGLIILGGRVTGLSGLVAGTSYYVASAAGSLTSTAPANARFVGVADSTTSLILTANPPPVAGRLLVYAAVQTIGFTASPTTVYPCNGTFTVTLPTVVGIGGRQIQIVNRGSGVLTLAAHAGETILGGATYTFNFGQYSSLTLVADEANLLWDIF